MIYATTITTSENVTEASPTKSPLKVTKGLVYKVEFDFPTGSMGLLKVWVQHGSFQVWPSTAGQRFQGDGSFISFDDTYLIDSEPFIFDIYTANLDDTYSHAVHIRIGIVSSDIFIARFLPTVGFDYFKQLLEQLQKEQEERKTEQERLIIESPFPGYGNLEEGE